MAADDTIFALATSRGRAAIAIIRISGTETCSVLQGLAGSTPEPRTATRRRIRNKSGKIIDDALVIRFQSGRSYTGEAMAELHLHGGRATVQAVLTTLENEFGLRQADAGEFTLRALRNGRMDIAQVEGLGDLIDAETESQRQLAMRVYRGSVGNRADDINESLTECLALIETQIEFSEENLPDEVLSMAVLAIDRLRSQLTVEVEGVEYAERLRSGFEVAIVGPPNIGKSTLANHIAGREAAITSSHAGTTRDIIEIHLDMRGLPVCLLDMAGLRDTNDPVESIGVSRALSRAQAADIRIFLTDGNILSNLKLRPTADDLVLSGKGDLLDDPLENAVSGVTGLGVDMLINHVVNTLENRVSRIANVTNDRHRHAIEQAIFHLGEAKHGLTSQASSDELAAEHIRSAIRSLEMLAGKIGVEQVLGQIFSRFCIGK